ncbi:MULTISPECIES: DUF6290 family protein [Brachyspira]|uniref:CopG domain protein DNA-binding domain protein n=2 Tax=Brachyspira TaxID=29521 RepID=A0ABX5B9S7_9SPIR|nr:MULTISPECIES: DUF6290 family protein [Brachyspira]KLI30741.1 hypothetical protein SZ49_05490 [Brachyspira hyodysenteriae]KLI54267.1 hypothetical protein SZ43_04505 [Brachyspira hyodysenteriae]KLI59544.1 hypothetical protein SZ44_08255 [Brachyspira hyodysenteriae]MCZ9850167.1 hypothetical protein [Brachyspira hyodysenteriae]MCZ9878132.1 hypothetical protein [Brachyspira hyodysenteriae]
MENNKNDNWGGKREGAGRKKIAPEKKIKPVKAISFKVNKDLYLQIEKIAKENNLSIGQYAKKILLEKIESTK